MAERAAARPEEKVNSSGASSESEELLQFTRLSSLIDLFPK